MNALNSPHVRVPESSTGEVHLGDLRHEMTRQQALLHTLWHPAAPRPAALRGLRPGHAATVEAGLAAYRSNAAATAARALAAAYPTVAALVGDEAFGALARTLWHSHPPERGDLAHWGAPLPELVADTRELDDEPYLADSARLDWAVHRAGFAADAPTRVPDLAPLALHDPAALRVTLAPGSVVVASRWPIATIWLAHQRPADDPQRFDAVREAFAHARAEDALVWRDGLHVRVAALDDAEVAFAHALLDARSLADALDAAGPNLDFERWLAQALATRRLVGVHLLETSP